jgi:hypothetical protein
MAANMRKRHNGNGFFVLFCGHDYSQIPRRFVLRAIAANISRRWRWGMW